MAAAEFREKSKGKLINKGMAEMAPLLNNACIGTIHSMAHQLISKYWYLMDGLGVTLNVMSEQNQQIYINQSMAEIATEEDYAFFDNYRVMFDVEDPMDKSGVQFWQKDLRQIIDYARANEIEQFKESRDYSLSQHTQLFPRKEKRYDVGQITKIIRQAIELDKKGKRSVAADNRIEAGKKLLGLSKESFNFLNKSGSYLGKLTKDVKKNLEGVDTLVSDLGEAWKSIIVFDNMEEYINRIFDMAERWSVEYLCFKGELGLVDYNDLEVYFLQLLDTPEVADELRGRYKVLFVDEFQDVSGIQYRIFEKLSLLMEQSYYVYDTKQAIYGFRGSDTRFTELLTDEARSGALEGTTFRQLTHSYRTVPSLVELTNSIFTTTFKMDAELVKLKPTRREMNHHGSSAIHWHLVDDEEKGNNELLYRNLAAQVDRLLQSGRLIVDKQTKEERPLICSDVAVLFRTNDKSEMLASELINRGIPVNRQSEGLLQQAEVKLTMAMLALLLDGRSELAKSELLLLTGAFEGLEGVIDSRLEYLEAAGEERWMSDNELLIRIEESRDRLMRQSVTNLVESLLLEFDLRQLASSWSDAEARLENLERLAQLAREYDERCDQMGLGSSLNGFLVHLNSLGDEAERSGQSHGVNLVTYHGSKGLEWPVVIMAELTNNPLDTKQLIRKGFSGVSIVREALTPQNLNPKACISLLPWIFGTHYNSKAPKELEDAITGTDRYKALIEAGESESNRLLYVGVTRARDLLITTAYQEKKLHWLENLGINLETLPIEKVKCKLEDVEDAIEEEITPKVRRILKGEYATGELRNISPSSLPALDGSTATLRYESGQRILLDGGAQTEMNIIGDCVHDALYLYEPSSEEARLRMVRTVQNYQLSSPIHFAERLHLAAEKLYGWLEQSYGVATKIEKELSFRYRSDGGQFVSGAIDLLWHTADGVVLVDYKSYPGAVELLTNPNHEHCATIHSGQLAGYRKALTKRGVEVKATLLYYAVSGAMVEVQ